jgi:acyl carrier protein
MTIAERVRDYICTELVEGVPPGALTDDFALIDSGVLDSIAIFQLAGFLEAEYRVAIEDADMTYENLRSLAAIAQLVEAKRSASAR